MIIYSDILSGDEVASDVFNIKEVDGVLYEFDCRQYKKGAESFQLEGANPSAEGEDADDGGESGETKMVLDVEESFRLVKVEPENKPSKKAFQGDLKKYMKRVMDTLKSNGADESVIKEFQSGAPAAVKKILGNYDNFDLYMGESMDGEAMYVLIDFREDGITPYATVWKHGLKETKV